MPIRDYARGDVVTASPDATAASLAATMEEKRVGSVVIVEDGEPVGIVTDRDIAVRVVAAGTDPSVPASAVMTPDPTTLAADAPILEATAAMYDATARRLPVTDDGALVGIIALDDLTVILANELTTLGSVVRAESPER